ncbi:MAG: c-type cytochrome [Nitrospirae bacterium]|nr:c-type cytochrome [Nitrospirota bacterium]MBI3351880.1 c-type cytochrome [Nitrospirota bacterium]
MDLLNFSSVQRKTTTRFIISLLVMLFLPHDGFGAEGQGDSIQPPIPLGLEESAFYVPKDNPMTRERVELGRFLFFDRRLSKDNSIACASCHIPALAFTDGQAVSSGIKHLQGGRSAPTVINRGFSKIQFWDGRAATMEEQAVGPLINPVEHGFGDHGEVVAKLRGIEGYGKEFKKAFGTDVITIGAVGKAIASFERTVLSGNSPADQYDSEGKEDAISDSAKRGLQLFRGKARCTKCHSGFNFTDEKFHNLGIGWDTATPDLGRYLVTKKSPEISAFKTPTLREIANTAPYMHDGRFGTLEEVVSFYNKGGIKNPFQDELIIPLDLTEQEKTDVVDFLRTLSGEGWQRIKAPAEFPQ